MLQALDLTSSVRFPRRPPSARTVNAAEEAALIQRARAAVAPAPSRQAKHGPDDLFPEGKD